MGDEKAKGQDSGLLLNLEVVPNLIAILWTGDSSLSKLENLFHSHYVVKIII